MGIGASDRLCLKQEVSQGEEGSSRFSDPIKKRGDKRKRLSALASAYHQQSRDQEGVSKELRCLQYP